MMKRKMKLITLCFVFMIIILLHTKNYREKDLMRIQREHTESILQIYDVNSIEEYNMSPSISTSEKINALNFDSNISLLKSDNLFDFLKTIFTICISSFIGAVFSWIVTTNKSKQKGK